MSQLSFFENEGDDLPAGLIAYRPAIFTPEESSTLIQRLKADIAWRQETILMYGKVLNTPRLTAWYGDRHKTYTYSGKKFYPFSWTNELLTIKQRIEQITSVCYNSVLLNYYRNGNDSVAWHADDEPELGINPVIASVSFGESRRFDIRHKFKRQQKYSIQLENGSLLIMKGNLQHEWEHRVPKSTKSLQERINLTFRVIF